MSYITRELERKFLKLNDFFEVMGNVIKSVSEHIFNRDIRFNLILRE